MIVLKVKLMNVAGKDSEQEIAVNEISVGDLLKRLDIDPFNVIVLKNGNVVLEHDILRNDDKVTISGFGCC